MRRIITMAAGLFLSLSLVAAANAAPIGKGGAPKTGQGLQNSKKVVQTKIDRMKKTQDLKKKGLVKRQQAMKK